MAMSFAASARLPSRGILPPRWRLLPPTGRWTFSCARAAPATCRAAI